MMTQPCRVLIVSVLLFLSLSVTIQGGVAPSALAFESLPQFRGLTPSQARSLDHPNELNSEYSSDHLTYQKPLEWERQWLSQDIVFDLSTGSLTGRYFQTEDRLKLRQSLYREFVEFRFTYFSQSDLEEQVEHHVMELLFSPFQLTETHPAITPLSLAVYGETALYKAENNMGVALVYLLPQSEHRLFANFPQFAHNKRHIDEDFFSEGEGAKAFGMYGHWWRNYNFIRYSLRHEPRARWIFPQNSYEYLYQRQHASVWWQWEAVDSVFWAGRLQLDSKWESKNSIEDSTLTNTEGNQRNRLFLQSHIRHWWRTVEWTWGLGYYERHWRINSEPILQRDLMPHFWLSPPEKASGFVSHRWHLGLEMTHHQRKPPRPAEDSAGDLLRRNEYRLNIKYALNFHQGQSEMNFLFTFDLDEFGSHQTWEGGAIQFRSYF